MYVSSSCKQFHAGAHAILPFSIFALDANHARTSLVCIWFHSLFFKLNSTYSILFTDWFRSACHWCISLNRSESHALTVEILILLIYVPNVLPSWCSNLTCSWHLTLAVDFSSDFKLLPCMYFVLKKSLTRLFSYALMLLIRYAEANIHACSLQTSKRHDDPNRKTSDFTNPHVFQVYACTEANVSWSGSFQRQRRATTLSGNLHYPVFIDARSSRRTAVGISRVSGVAFLLACTQQLGAACMPTGAPQKRDCENLHRALTAWNSYTRLHISLTSLISHYTSHMSRETNLESDASVPHHCLAGSTLK